MAKQLLNDQYTPLQKKLIDELAAIEQSDRNMCQGCGGEDCACCEIYIDRQKWVGPDELFRDADPFESWHDDDGHRMEYEDDEDYDGEEEVDLDSMDLEDQFAYLLKAGDNEVNYCDHDEVELTEPLTPSPPRRNDSTPCDSGPCPFDAPSGESCRYHCNWPPAELQ